MIAEVLLPKSNGDAPGKEVAEMYDEDRQGERGPYLADARTRLLHQITGKDPRGADYQPRWRGQSGPIHAAKSRPHSNQDSSWRRLRLRPVQARDKRSKERGMQAEYRSEGPNYGRVNA